MNLEVGYLHQQIDKLSDSDLELAGKQLEIFDLKQRLDQLCEDYGTNWHAGRATQAMVDEAVRDYRSRHPSDARGWMAEPSQLVARG